MSLLESGNVIAAPPTVRFAWIAAQWAWSQNSRNRSPEPSRLRVTMTFMLPEEVGTQQRPHRITFNLTDRLREFQAANTFQKHIKTLVILRQDRWIGKARIRQSRTEPVQDLHRRNIPDLTMSAWIESAVIHARLWTPIQQIDLVFDQDLTEKQQQCYEGAAVWGTQPRRPRPRDDFYDWIAHA
jgi:hypothetical protein